MAETFKFELVSPERVLISEDARQVVLPGSEGDFAVLAGHAPVVAQLRPGFIEAELAGGEKRRILVHGGFAEVDPAQATVLADKVIDTRELKGERLEAEVTAAAADLAKAGDDETRFMADALVASLKSVG